MERLGKKMSYHLLFSLLLRYAPTTALLLHKTAANHKKDNLCVEEKYNE